MTTKTSGQTALLVNDVGNKSFGDNNGQTKIAATAAGKGQRYSLRHRLSDQKWRQNVNNAFTALKKVVTKHGVVVNSKQETTADNEMPPKVVSKSNRIQKPKRKISKGMSKLKTLETTVDLTAALESRFENAVNEKQNELMDVFIKSSANTAADKPPLIAVNALQKLKDTFAAFEKRFELENKQPKKRTVELTNDKTTASVNTVIDKAVINDFIDDTTDDCKQTACISVDNQSLYTLLSENVANEVVINEVNDFNQLDIKPNIIESTTTTTTTSKWSQIKQMTNTDTDSTYFDYKYFPIDLWPLDITDSLTPLMPCDPYSMPWGPWDPLDSDIDYDLTTDLVEHLAATMPVPLTTGFGGGGGGGSFIDSMFDNSYNL